MLAGPEVGYPSPHSDPVIVATEFLKSLRAGITDTTTAGALTALAALADHDDISATALRTIVADRSAALNLLLTQTGRTVRADEFARLVGPVLFARFFARQPITDKFIGQTVAATATAALPVTTAASGTSGRHCGRCRKSADPGEGAASQSTR